MTKRIYQVTVSLTAYVLAESPRQAEEWATENVTEISDTKPSADACEVSAAPKGVGASLPWVACGLRDDEFGRTIAEWLAVTQ